MVQASRGARAEDGDDLYQEHQHQAGGVHHVVLADIEALDDGQGTQAAAADGAGQCRIAQNGGDADGSAIDQGGQSLGQEHLENDLLVPTRG